MTAKNFNPLDYPACLSYPLRMAQTAWAAHVPFAMFLVEALKPRLLVELGTFTGVSYCAFCQAVKELKLNTRCYALDTWEGDAHTGFYDQHILHDLKEHHDKLYEGFSTLIQSTFDAALCHFAIGTIDLLHIDGHHTYVSVKHDFENWLPKMSPGGIVLFHDVNVRERDFGVWKLWEELKPAYPHFEFAHEHGLGVLAVGSSIPEGLRPLFDSTEQQATVIREFFSQLGQRLRVRLEKDHQIEALSWQVKDKEQTIRSLEAQQRDTHSLSRELAAKEGYLRDIMDSKAWRYVVQYWRLRSRVSEALSNLFNPSRIMRRAKLAKQVAHPEHRPGSAKALTLMPTPRGAELETVVNGSFSNAPARRADIICFSIIEWEFRYQRPQQIMSQFAAHGHRVFYIRLDEFLPNDASPRFSARKLRENLYEIKLAAARHQWVNLESIVGNNAEALINSLDDLRKTLHIDEAVSYVQIPSWAAVALAAKERWGWRLVYDCMDEWKDFPGLGRSISETEPELVKCCDLLIATSQRLYDKWSASDLPLVLARNAVDYDFYLERYHPNDALPGETHPIVGFYGAIAAWFDVELATEVARARPEYTFVFLGGIFDVDVSELRSLPNVRLLGQRPYEEMPEYLYHFDACLIPFKINSITHATDPVKMYEYLSAGKPVVSVALSELEPFRDYIYLARDREDFLIQLDKAVAENDPVLVSTRRRFAAENTWTERYDVILGAIRSATPRASIIVISYNNLPLTRLCLESILVNTEYPNYEVIVVDNNSSDGTQAYLRYLAAQHSHIEIILNSQNHGFARANNQGIERSSGEYLVLLNNDTVVPPGWLSRLLHHLRRPSVGMVGPVTNCAGNEARIEVPYRTWSEMESFAAEHTWERDGQAADIKVLAMYCVALKRATYDAVGPLDEQFGIGMFEDDDYTQRLRAKGYRILCAADVFVHHFGQAAFKKLIDSGEYQKLFDENRHRFETKWNVKWIPHQHGLLPFERIEG